MYGSHILVHNIKRVALCFFYFPLLYVVPGKLETLPDLWTKIIMQEILIEFFFHYIQFVLRNVAQISFWYNQNNYIYFI